ncbi:FAD-dependent oxidoreductase [Amycolatopsis alba]|uniref:FAD-dependent oxidoreductase n=1 Tax=Amycolatopsis alba TaxID=76020 RepID=UPI0003AB0F50|nr:FAD-dependent monooxygenase [Amycolatopsis alba]
MSSGRHGPRVVIIGGGVGGLILAQGLHAAGLPVTVHERDESPRVRTQGYRLRISPDGERAMRECLPPRVLELLLATSNERHGHGLLAFDEQLHPQWAPEFDDPRGPGPDKIDAVDRVTLRRVLLAGLGDVVRFGRRLTRVEEDADGVTAHFASGESATGDVLVAADGANSVVRNQLCPAERPRDLGVRTVFARLPMEGVHRAGLPEGLRGAFSYVIGSDGHHLGLMPMVFREPPSRAAARLWPGLDLPPGEDYYMAVLNVHRDELAMPDPEFFALDGRALAGFAAVRMRDWHPGLRGLFGLGDPRDTFAVSLRADLPVRPWGTDRIVALGDAAHTMPPSGGVGANSAAWDAALLTRLFRQVADGGTTLPAAFGRYREAVTEHATEAVSLSLKIAQWSIRKIDIEAPAAGFEKSANHSR